MNNRIAGIATARRGKWAVSGLVVITAILSLLISATAADNGAYPLWMEPYPLMDTVYQTEGSFPIDTVSLGDRLLFFTYGPYSTAGNSIELWRTDGTSEGTLRLRRQINWNPEGILALNEAAVFAAEEPATGRELWITHGQHDDPHVLADIKPGIASSDPALLTRAGDYVYFRTNDDLPANALWRTDGTAAGTVKVKVFDADDGHPDGNSIVELVGTDHYLFFLVYTSDSHTLWRSDGTPDGTILLHTIEHNYQFGVPPLLMAHGDIAFFLYNQDFRQSDGTPEGTWQLTNRPPHVHNTLWAAGDNYLYMMIDSYSGHNTRDIWRTDDSSDGMKKVAVIGGYTQGVTKEIITIGDKLFFANSPQEYDDPHGVELWVSDGTAGGTKMVKDIVPGPDGSIPGGFVVVGGIVYFSTRGGYELWRSDGTANGTFRVPLDNDDPSYPLIQPLEEFKNKLFLFAGHDVFGREPWISDGTAQGSFMIKDTNSDNTDPSHPSNPAFYRDKFYFVVEGGLWMSDGRDREPTLLVGPQQSNGYVSQFEPNFAGSNGYLFFTVADINAGNIRLWRTDNTAAGTIPLQVVGAASFSNPVRELTDVSNVMYFVTGSGPSESALWRSDGSPAGTFPFVDFNAEAHGLTASGNRLFFAVAGDSSTGVELWLSNGTAAGTNRVKDINPGHADSRPSHLTDNDGIVYFAANDGQHGVELWRSNGTPGGTYLVKDVNPAPGQSSSPGNLVVMGGILYFLADDGVHGVELWRSDGTAAGTFMVKDAMLGGSHPPAMELTAGRNKLFFVAGPDDFRYQPWTSDGTAAGTSMIASVADDSAPDMFRELTAVDDTLFFALQQQLYRSDGTAAGTVQINQLFPFVEWYDPYHLLGAPGRLFFSADSRTFGREPFVAMTSLVQLSPDFLYLPEGGVSKRFTIVLNRPPSAAVNVVLSGSEPLVITPTALTFTPANWNTPQSVTVAAPGDEIEQGTRPAEVTLNITSQDAIFNDDSHTLPVLVREWRYAFAPMVVR